MLSLSYQTEQHNYFEQTITVMATAEHCSHIQAEMNIKIIWREFVCRQSRSWCNQATHSIRIFVRATTTSQSDQGPRAVRAGELLPISHNFSRHFWLSLCCLSFHSIPFCTLLFYSILFWSIFNDSDTWIRTRHAREIAKIVHAFLKWIIVDRPQSREESSRAGGISGRKDGLAGRQAGRPKCQVLALQA